MRMLLSLSFALTAVSALQADENPFKSAKEGDWAEYKVAAISMGSPLDDIKLKWTVAANDGMVVTVKKTAIDGKNEIPGPEIKIDLSQPYNPAVTAGLPADAATTIEKLETGKEKIKAGGKEHDCTWTKYKVTGSFMGMDTESELKVWTSKDAPLSGMVKLEMKNKHVEFAAELAGSGTK
jgi:hypothetical protein